MKVCGVTEPSEIDVLASQPVDFVGLWYGVPDGPSDLPLDVWREFGAAAAATPRLTPVLVTFLKDKDALREAIETSDVSWVQLHGYQTPGLVRAVKEISPDVRVLKVLHVREGECIESRLIGGYEKAGVDVFLFDAVSADGRVGSTGETLDADLVASLAEELDRPFLLAGGISAENRANYDAVAANSRFLGIDVDTNARGPDGKISADNVEAICRAWEAPDA
ncbi:MAG: N-(5'-phosphoribosyl)anthranilate isomerase [Chloroflexi bacterium]|nr:N-(5'-phosphoribosyl)anthranilate isomerase [Chloroflexota bacterium]